ncbi:MAG: hypothetical protein JNJ57_08930 [Saprospiraceae bacterium]|nr:hypothetical protein [Saprospiraceae bacterium]
MRSYPAKLLLFGEHVLLLGNTALAVPLRKFKGFWQEHLDSTAVSNLLPFAESQHLRQLNLIDTERFAKELKGGLVYQSEIPIGYGLGSSGALCAAVYDRFALEKTENLQLLKKYFAAMENYFHGASSGIDPLTSYLNHPVLIRNKNDVSLTDGLSWTAAPQVFLLDSSQPRDTGSMVRWFQEQLTLPAFSEAVYETYLPYHELLIESWLDANDQNFWKALDVVSAFQYQHLKPMIPDHLHEIWEAGLNTGSYLLKLCGAGGGGFFLGFAKSSLETLPLQEKFSLVTDAI